MLDWIGDPFQVLHLPFGEWVKGGITWAVDSWRPFFQTLRIPVTTLLRSIQQGLTASPPTLVLGSLTVVAWQLAGWQVGMLCLGSLFWIGVVGVWQEAMVSLSLVVTAVLICIGLGIPLGVMAARWPYAAQILRPVLDAMQTLPVFVYLVPVVMLFGVGEAPGVIATIIYAMPPLIRLTDLGIRQVPPEVVEASLAFGATPMQLLWEVQLPLATPMILAGVNQTVLFALGMSVITSMIAVPGLGLVVLRGLNSLDVGLAATGGMGILLLAIVLDRLTQKIGQPDFHRQWYRRGLIGWIRTHRRWLNPTRPSSI